MSTVILVPAADETPVDYQSDEGALCPRPESLAGVRIDNLRPLVLRLLTHVARDLDTVSVDEIDGEFYWRHCKWYRSTPLGIVRFFLDALSVPDFTHDTAGLLHSLQIYAQRATLALTALAEANQLFPHPVLHRLHNQERVQMRAPFVLQWTDGDQILGYAIRTTSGAWRGADVEAALQQCIAEIEQIGAVRFRAGAEKSNLVFTHPPAGNADERTELGALIAADGSVHVGMHMRFRFLTESPVEEADADPFTQQWPCVETFVHLPLPPLTACLPGSTTGLSGSSSNGICFCRERRVRRIRRSRCGHGPLAC